MLLNHFDLQFESSFQAESVSTTVLDILTDPPFSIKLSSSSYPQNIDIRVYHLKQVPSYTFRMQTILRLKYLNLSWSELGKFLDN